MYRPSEVLLLDMLEAEFPKLDAQLQNPDSPLNEHLSGYSDTEKDTIKKEYRKARESLKFTEAFPREAANLPVVVVEEREQTETEQGLGTMGDSTEIDAEGKEVLESQFVFRKTVGIEIVAKNKDAVKHLTVLIRFMFLIRRLTFEGLGMRMQRVQQVSGLTREVGEFPEEAFVRTILFTYTTDEFVKVLSDVPVITKVQPIHREVA